MNHPDFRVHGKVFATLDSPKAGWGMVRLTPEDQQRLARAQPDVFMPAKGAWGTAGCTHVKLGAGGVCKRDLILAMLAAWKNTAPAAMVRELGVLSEATEGDAAKTPRKSAPKRQKTKKRR